MNSTSASPAAAHRRYDMGLSRLVVPLVLALVLPTLAVGAVVAQTPAPGFDGDPATTERINAADPATAALTVSQSRFSDSGATRGRQASHAVVATGAEFADSLAGAALTGDGPLLLSDGAALSPATGTELTRVLPPGATVYLLGGTAALSAQVAADITNLGLTARRLSGDTRVETAVAVADEVRRLYPGGVVLLARSEGAPGNPTSAFADSMTGGSLAANAGIPILVTPTDQMHPAVAAWLAADTPTSTVLLGGTAALSQRVFDAAPNASRLSGPERTATAAAIAASPLWGTRSARQFVILDGARADGWAYGLAAAGLAADADAPPLLIINAADLVTAETRRLVSACGPADVDLVLIGDTTVISQAVETTLTTFDGQSCTAEFAALNTFPDCTTTLQYFIDEALERVGPYGLDAFYYGAPEIFVDDVAPRPVPAQGEDSASDGGPSTAPPPPPPAPPPPSSGEPQASPESGEAPAADGNSSSGGAPNTDVSETNVQEVGVDEPDRIKLNADAAYIANGQGVEVMDLRTDSAAAHVRTLDVKGGVFGQELLLDDDILLVLGRGDGYIQPADSAPAETSFAPSFYYPDPTTHIARFDVSDPLNPVQLDATTIDGDYRSARMIDGTVRLVTSSNPTGLHFVFPSDSSQEAQNAAFAHNVEVIEESTLDAWLPMVGDGADATSAVDCGAVFAPPGFSGISTILVTTLDVATSVQPTSSAAIVAQGETIYASRNRLVVSSSQWGVWTDDLPDAVTTELHSFDISDPDATSYVGSGTVPGYILNSFALSEQNGYYRVATTTEAPWRADELPQGSTDNGITILTEGGSELFQVGQVMGLGLGERIFAVRYLGDIAAVVTFRQTDPLYIVNLTNPAAPSVTGELKIPGVSRYLHPLGSDHLLGVGQDGDEDGRLTGLQVSLFDISDRANPTRVDSLEFGPGESPVEYDHKAFLFWNPLQRALVPSNLHSADFRNFRAGVQAIDVSTADNQLTLAGEVRQPDPDEFHPRVDRTFIARGILYTVSYLGVGSHDLTSLQDYGFATFPEGAGDCCIAIEDGPGGPPPGPPEEAEAAPAAEPDRPPEDGLA